MMFASPTQWLSPSIRITALLILTVVCGLLGSGVAFGQAQSNASDLQGVVRDPGGAVVSGATVTARNPATNTSKTTTTNDEGAYLIVNLTPGEYEVTVEAPNFKKAVLPGVKLTVGHGLPPRTNVTCGIVSSRSRGSLSLGGSTICSVASVRTICLSSQAICK